MEVIKQLQVFDGDDGILGVETKDDEEAFVSSDEVTLGLVQASAARSTCGSMPEARSETKRPIRLLSGTMQPAFFTCIVQPHPEGVEILVLSPLSQRLRHPREARSDIGGLPASNSKDCGCNLNDRAASVMFPDLSEFPRNRMREHVTSRSVGELVGNHRSYPENC